MQILFVNTITRCHRYPVADPAAGWLGMVVKKHEIYAAVFGGHPFYDLFLQGLGVGFDINSIADVTCEQRYKTHVEL